MKRQVVGMAAVAALALVLTGCMTDAERRAERISQNQTLYMQLDQATQSRVSQGLIAIGDTPSAVWLALGEPSKRTSDTTAAATVEIWQYFNSIPEEYTVLVPDPPPPGIRPPPPGFPVPSHYETRTRYVSVVSLQIQFDNGRVSRIQQF
ncbi:MAG: hypothetical protein IJK04_11600 [Kiritimatiellae bacterium]|nr:hypothetical protein [Kiritimatiellia bacterium]